MIYATLPKGTQACRALLCVARAGADGDPREIARNIYGATSEVVNVVRAIVEAGGIGSGQWGSVLASAAFQEFFAAVEQASILGKLASLRRVPLNVRLQVMASGFTSYWVGGGKGKPISKASADGRYAGAAQRRGDGRPPEGISTFLQPRLKHASAPT